MKRIGLRPLRLCALLAALLGPVRDGFAHADLDEQVVAITALIVADPTNASQWLHRADLHRRHGEFARAVADLAVAENLRPGSPDTQMSRAQIFWDEGDLRAAWKSAGEILQNQPAHGAALVLRGRCFFRLGQAAAAAADFSTAIKLDPLPSPDLLLERARVQAGAGDFAAAVAGLDEGIQKLGHVPSLEIPAIEFERAGKNFSAALARVDKIIARYPTREPWLAWRGEILEEAGRFAEAREAFDKVLAGLAAYPPARRGLALTAQLESRARDGLSRTEAKLSPNSSPPSANLHSALKSTP